jgi:hypothetical protein
MKNQYFVRVQPQPGLPRDFHMAQVSISFEDNIRIYKSGLKTLAAFSLALALANDQDAAKSAYNASFKRTRKFHSRPVEQHRGIGSPVTHERIILDGKPMILKHND